MNAADAAMSARVSSGTRPLLGAGAGLRYGALGFALAFLSLPLYVVLPSHYASTHGLALATLGIVLLLTRVLDAALDPFIGQAVDAVFARSTRHAWWLGAAAAVSVGAGFALLFLLPAGSWAACC
jgi:GPH family glycoside/pentoside/hexuronide:cation symporter